MTTANYTGKPSNISQWQPTIPVNQSIYETDTTQRAPLGAKLIVGDRTFYYAQLGTSANVVAGLIVCAPAPTASHQADIFVPAATSAGVTTIAVSSGAAMVADQYAEGTMIVSSGTGDGMTYRIKTHPAHSSGALGWGITLYDPIAEPMTATSEVNFIPNIYKGVAVGSALLDMPVGITPTAVTTGEYFWVQTYGLAGVYNSAALAEGQIVIHATLGYAGVIINGTTAGSLVQGVVGKNINLAGTATEKTPIFVTIRP
jgi:hypothetical protein